MIRHQLVQWILLPNGLTADGQLSASVFVAPRLRPSEPATLADFPDFADWRSVLDGLHLVLERSDGATEVPMSVAVSASGALWQALFPATTTVRAFEFDDFADRPLISYPVGEVLSHLREQWAALALHALEELPVTNRNAAPIGPPPSGPSERRVTLADHFTDLRIAVRHEIFTMSATAKTSRGGCGAAWTTPQSRRGAFDSSTACSPKPSSAPSVRGAAPQRLSMLWRDFTPALHGSCPRSSPRIGSRPRQNSRRPWTSTTISPP
ncbi:hypothetical protein GCM10009827_057080 [Dactylosporangium maewongense]|uniref:Uncharacterized protein n=1 Tax=Dactylosporangium maewongense TaxID=634393 RepID=A0ABP4LUF6_9ACTN